MREAIALTSQCPARPFATVIVDTATNVVVSRGWNRVDASPILHGEIDAIGKLFKSGVPLYPNRLALVTTAEPCPMCMAAILWSGIGGVAFGTSIPFLRGHGWRQIDIEAMEIVERSDLVPCQVVGGVLEDRCNALFRAGPKKDKRNAR